MSAKFQAVLVNDPECFVKKLPTIFFEKGTDVTADDAQHVVVGLAPTTPEIENDVFKYVEASGALGDYILAKRPCTLMYSGVIFRSDTTARGILLVPQGNATDDYGQTSGTFFSTGVVAPASETVFDVAGIVTLDTGEGFSFLIDNDSVDTVAVSMTITSVNPA